MAERIEVLLTEEKINTRIRELGEQISKDYAGENIHLICILKGGSFLCVNLQKGLPFL